MKYNDNGTYKDIYVKTFDTLPVGAIVEYSGSTIPSGWTDIGNNQIQKTSQYIEGGAGLPSYFTDEIDTGMKWIDGKPIYRKVIVANLNGTYSESGQRYTFINNALGGAGTVDSMIRLDATYIRDNGDRIYNLFKGSISGISGLEGTIAYRLTSNNNPVDMFQVAIPTSVTTAVNPVVTIITEYTKQSD